MNWTVGITAAPRSGDYLARTYTAVSKNFPDVHIFGEPGVESYSGQLHINGEQFGDWSNWLVGLFTLVMIRPKADYYLMLEDDVTMCCNLQYYLEGVIPQLRPFAAMSIYTPSRYARMPFTIHNEGHGVQTWGSQAMIFGREEAIRFLSSPEVLRHRAYGMTYQGRDISNARKDAIIGLWAEREKLPIYYPSPSLAQHVGINSTMDNEPNQASDYVGDDFDAMQLVEHPMRIIPNLTSRLF